MRELWNAEAVGGHESGLALDAAEAPIKGELNPRLQGKIPYLLGFVAALLTLQPAYDSFNSYSLIASIHLTLGRAYLILAAILFAALYFYGWLWFQGTSSKLAVQVADGLFAAGIGFPPLILGLSLVEFLSRGFGVTLVDWLVALVQLMVGLMSGTVAWQGYQLLQSHRIDLSVRKYAAAERKALAAAERCLRQGDYEESAHASRQAVLFRVNALRIRHLSGKDNDDWDALNTLVEMQQVTPDAFSVLDFLADIATLERGVEPNPNQEHARDALVLARHVLSNSKSA